MSSQSSVAEAGLVAATISASRSGLVSAMCNSATSALPPQATARIPPHQPVPMTPTFIRFKIRAFQ